MNTLLESVNTLLESVNTLPESVNGLRVVAAASGTGDSTAWTSAFRLEIATFQGAAVLSRTRGVRRITSFGRSLLSGPALELRFVTRAGDRVDSACTPTVHRLIPVTWLRAPQFQLRPDTGQSD